MGRPFVAMDNVFDADLELPAADTSDAVTVHVTLTGLPARRLMVEASRRGVSYNDMAAVLLEQGMYFWNGAR